MRIHVRKYLVASALGLGGAGSLVMGIVMTATPAHAQITVFDPGNYSQNILTAARTLQQINNQISSLRNQAQSLINQARNLASLPYSALSELQKTVAKTRALISEAQNIAYEVRSIDENFRKLYSLDALIGSDKSLVLNAQARWKNTVGGLQDAMRLQATVMVNLTDHQSQVSALVTASQSANGALSATQAGNQILALQAQQLSDLTALLASNARAQNIKAADDAQAAAEAQEKRRRFLQRKTGYQPGSAQMFYGN